YGIPWRWSATAVAALALVLVALVFLFVPPATDALVQSENLAYLRGHVGMLAVIALRWPLAPLLTAFLLDVTRVTDRQGVGQLPWLVVAFVVLSGAWAPTADPVVAFYALLSVGKLRGIIALAFGVLGAWGGAKVGQEMGLGLRFVERS
ncbi:MAG: hypothetical protein H0X24_13655, partial [Ktedonobacterales bacterium]|nr:hypothetical protein [Ktedonobacterales bacterium]